MSSVLVRRFFLAAALTLGASFLPQSVIAEPAAGLPDFTNLAKEVSPAVVSIRTTLRVRQISNGWQPGFDDGDMSEFFRHFFGIPLPQRRDRSPAPYGGNQDQPEVERNNGMGSGFILSSDGYVVTNAHVVNDADAIYVTLTDKSDGKSDSKQNNKREFKATLIGMDKPTDVALLKIDAANLPTVVRGDPNKVEAGAWVVAIGSPFGLENTVTAGIVSMKARNTGDYLPFIQSTVVLNPGSSGGPLINMRGEVIGINSQIYSRTGGFMGISFSIPIDEVNWVVDQLKTSGHVVRGRIAVAIGMVTKDVADSLGLSKVQGAPQGALVSSVEPGGPADKAGVQPGDIILKFNGRDVDAATDLPRMVGKTRPGTRATLTVWRQRKMRNLQVVVAAMQPEKIARDQSSQRLSPRERAPNPLGLAVNDMSADQLKALNLKNGVRVEAANGPAARVGVQRGDIILRIGDVDVTSAKQFDMLMRRLDPNKMVALLVRRGDNTQFVPVRPRPAPAQP